jgi:hypothetical protein
VLTSSKLAALFGLSLFAVMTRSGRGVLKNMFHVPARQVLSCTRLYTALPLLCYF